MSHSIILSISPQKVAIMSHDHPYYLLWIRKLKLGDLLPQAMATDRIALPTENYEPYYRSLSEFDRIVEENSDLVARIARVIDEKLTYPQNPQTEGSELNEICDSSAPELESSSSEVIADSSDEHKRPNQEEIGLKQESRDFHDKESIKSKEPLQEDGIGADSLREYLNVALLLDSAPVDVPKLDMIKNDRVRQLLQDNYKLANLQRMKRRTNQELLKILSEYELLLARVVIPQLFKQFSTRNFRLVEDLRGKILPQRNEEETKIWNKHVEYVENLERLKKLTNSIAAVSENLIESPELNRVGAQLAIVENLMDYASNKENSRESSRNT